MNSRKRCHLERYKASCILFITVMFFFLPEEGPSFRAETSRINN